MAELITRKLKSSSILETVIAMTIMLFMFSTLTVIYVQMITPSVSLKLVKAHHLLKNYSCESTVKCEYNDEERREGIFILTRKNTEMEEMPELARVHFSITDMNGKILDQIDELVKRESN